MIIAWNVLRHFYPYADLVGIDWDAELAKALTAVACAGEPAPFLHAFRELVAALKDGHAGVYGPERKDRGYPDVRVAMVQGRPRVLSCGKAVQDLPLGSEILTVDEEPMAKRIAYLTAEISSPTSGWRNTVLGDRLLEGPKTQPVRIGFQPISGPAGSLLLPRDGKPGTLAFPHAPSPFAEVRPGVWYINASQTTDAEFESRISELNNAKGLVFDLREYPAMAGFRQHLSAHELATDIFQMPVITAPNGQGLAWEVLGASRPSKLQPKKPLLKAKAVFLAGGFSISAGETLLGMVLANRLGPIVGEPTAGTNGNINRLLLPGGYEMAFTGTRATKHNGAPHHGVGIAPDIPCQPTVKGIAEGRDEVLEKGVELRD